MRTLLQIVGLTVLAFAAGEKCDLKGIDECSKAVIPFADSTTLGTSKEEIDADCKVAETSLACLKKHSQSRCVKSGLAQGIFKLMIEGAETVNAWRCDSSDPKHEEFLKYVPCINTVGSKVQNCGKQMILELDAIAKMPVNERVARACCSYTKLMECSREVLEKACSTEHADFIESALRGISEATTETICVRFSPNSCKKFSPLKLGQRSEYMTIVPQMTEILNV
ncbi:hypothetical protein BIW11_06220 [Tropilaelaps mercedesae]|uniref:Uncharacterized protein n=1 Tax=Tropilaelaps mercedesae TaxID=418985 RepID=A0A1V9XZ05_9ACAR|nr:hypothetical protein BIW11_06220 [Tropilaelaps mercedesae]